MTSEESKKILDGVRANLQRLEDCSAPHDFSPVDNHLGADHRCSKCGGVVRNDQARWYTRGLRDAAAHLADEKGGS